MELNKLYSRAEQQDHFPTSHMSSLTHKRTGFTEKSPGPLDTERP